MAEQVFNIKSGFHDSINGDRRYNANEMNRPYKRVITEGVFATPQGTPSTDLQVVSANNALNIIVKAGEGLLGGKWFELETDTTITVSSNTDIVPRRDSIIIQIDNRQNGRIAKVIYREGTPNSNPQPPAISTSDNLIEKRVANIYVAAGANYIGQDAIVDLRGSSECPWITSLIKQVDTSTLYDQYHEAYQRYYDTETEAFNAFMEGLTSQLAVNTNLAIYESHYTSATEVTEIPINIATYDKNRDVLMVFVNRLRATPNIDYTISLDGSKIILTNSIYANQNVNFLVMKSIIDADAQTIEMELQAINNALAILNADTGWANFELVGGATAYSEGLIPAYRKCNKDIYIRGCIKGAALYATFATLPEGFRPAMTRYFTIATGNVTATIEIGTNGQMKIANVIGTLTTGTLIPIDTHFIIG